jgi:hypothetical protein
MAAHPQRAKSGSDDIVGESAATIDNHEFAEHDERLFRLVLASGVAAVSVPARPDGRPGRHRPLAPSRECMSSALVDATSGALPVARSSCLRPVGSRCCSVGKGQSPAWVAGAVSAYPLAWGDRLSRLLEQEGLTAAEAMAGSSSMGRGRWLRCGRFRAEAGRHARSGSG